MSARTTKLVDLVRMSADRQLSTHVLFAFYVCSIGAVVVTNDAALPGKFLLYFTLPFFLIDLATQATFSSPVHMPITRLFRSWILWIAAAYFLVLIISTVASSGLQPAFGHRIREYIGWAAELLLFMGITAHLAVSYTNFFKRLLLIIGALLVVNALVNIKLFLDVTPLEQIFPWRFTARFATPSFRNATHLAPLYSIYAMALLAFAATTNLARWERLAVAVIVTVLLAGLVLTQSRGSLSAVVVAAILIACVATWRWRIALAISLVILVGALWSSPAFREAMLVRGTSARPDLWKAFLDLAAVHPGLGYGLDRILELNVGGVDFEQPHNTVLWAQVRGGAVAAVLAAIILLGSLFATFRWWLTTSNFALAAALVVLAIISITEIGLIVLPYSWVWVVFWLPIGMSAGAELNHRLRPAVASERSPVPASHVSLSQIFRPTALTPTLQRAAVLITGASSGIGAAYAERFAHRGHDLVLVARNEERLRKLATKLHALTGVNVDILPADLTKAEQRALVEARLRSDDRIGILVNNAGAASPGSFANPDLAAAENLIDLNVTAVVRLAGAVIPRFLSQRSGAIINVSSALALVPESALGIYGATKSFVLAFSQNMQAEIGPRGIYVQAVLPAATATEIWERSGRDPGAIPNMMNVSALVDAALLGFDRREAVTIPPLPDVRQWEAYETARRAMAPNFRQKIPAKRYRV